MKMVPVRSSAPGPAVCVSHCAPRAMQDMKNGWAWHARDTSNAERVHHNVEYLATDDHKYIDLDLHVHYYPPSRDTVPDGSGRPDISSYIYSYLDDDMHDDDDEDSHVFAQVSKAC